MGRARAVAGQLDSSGADPEALIRAAFRRILLRAPDSEELAAAVELWQGAEGANPLETLCQALLNLNEFNYVE